MCVCVGEGVWLKERACSPGGRERERERENWKLARKVGERKIDRSDARTVIEELRRGKSE